MSLACHIHGTTPWIDSINPDDGVQNHCSGPSTSEISKSGGNRVFQHCGRIGLFMVGQAEVVCMVVVVLACVWFCLECVHACSSCFALSLCRSVSARLCRSQLRVCWEVMKWHRCQKALWEKLMVGGSPNVSRSHWVR